MHVWKIIEKFNINEKVKLYISQIMSMQKKDY